MPWRDPPADQKVVSSKCISSALNRLQGAKGLSPVFVLLSRRAEADPGDGEY
jgi:hypothetical protein